jgi:hypothetical protein
VQVVALAHKPGMGRLLHHKLQVGRRQPWPLVALARKSNLRALSLRCPRSVCACMCVRVSVSMCCKSRGWGTGGGRCEGGNDGISR